MTRDEEKKLLDQQPAILRIAYRLLGHARKDILTGKCNPDTVEEAMTAINAESNGYVHPKDYVTIDEGMEILGMGQNRNKFCRTMKDNNIENKKFKNLNIGYRRSSIFKLLLRSNK